GIFVMPIAPASEIANARAPGLASPHGTMRTPPETAATVQSTGMDQRLTTSPDEESSTASSASSARSPPARSMRTTRATATFPLQQQCGCTSTTLGSPLASGPAQNDISNAFSLDREHAQNAITAPRSTWRTCEIMLHQLQLSDSSDALRVRASR